MKKKTLGIIASTTALVAVAGTVGWQVADKEVQVAVDGQTSTVNTFGSTVADALAAKGITVSEHDTVVPSPASRISDGMKIAVNYGRPLTITLDGKKTTLWTTATSVDSALGQLGVIEAGTKLSVSRSTPLGREGLALTAVSPKQVTLTAGGKDRPVITTAATVADLLKEQKITVGKTDKLTPAATTAITEKMAVKLQRVATKQETTTEDIEHETERIKSSKLDKGTTKVRVEGKDGVTTKTWQVTVVDGKAADRKLLSEKVTTKPVTEEILVGTREEAPEETSSREESSSRDSSSSSSESTSSPRKAPSNKPSASSSSTPTSSGSSSSGGSLNVANQAMWERIAQCESGGNWSINTGNGYYGGLQFDRQTWLGAGGGAYAPTANLASKAQQITIANKVYADRGLQPWGCRHAA
ncbi:ubiquitin-like domain-containing protein [Luteococcus sp. Sow4_B9]|uniref:ubiquitin-like domain-containing protein n=1 Tax=Luteococcus sp. Sow4_B9 TaxID=3438792 RepID=UPI003F9B5109